MHIRAVPRVIVARRGANHCFDKLNFCLECTIVLVAMPCANSAACSLKNKKKRPCQDLVIE